MPLDRHWIEQRIPHKGTMCLLDAVVSWDAARISCRSRSHRREDNPLRAHGRLGIACGIEYAAQAMAVHAVLIASGASANPTQSRKSSTAAVPAAGFLASVRSVRFHALRLDDVPGDLLCSARFAAGDSRSALYEFELRSAVACLMSGRATVILDTGHAAFQEAPRP